MRGGLRRRPPELGTESLVVVAETRAAEPGGARRASRRAVTERVAAAIGVAAGRGGAGAAGRGAQDLEREDPPRRHARALPGEARSGAARGSGPGTPRALVPGAAVARGRGAGCGACRASSTPPTWRRSLAAGPAASVVGGWCSWRRAGARRVRSRPARRAPAAAPGAAAGCPSEGVEHLAGPGPLVLASNHASYVDVPVLMALAARGLRRSWPRRRSSRWPLVRALRAQGRPPDRGPLRRARRAWPTRARSRARWSAGRTVLFFPEGTFTAAAGLRPFRLGAFKAAAETGRRGAPRAAGGRASVLRAGEPGPGPGRMRLWIGAPIRRRGRRLAGRGRRCATAWPTPSPRTAASRASTWWRRARSARERVARRRAAAASKTSSRRAGSSARISPPTPLRRRSPARPGPRWLKLECWQPTGSFKVRGRAELPASLSAERAAARGGGRVRGQPRARAWPSPRQRWAAASRRRCSCRETAPRAKVDKLRTFPVDRARGRPDLRRRARARPWSTRERTGATYVHAFEDPRTAAGQGTVALEILEQLPGRGAPSWCRWAAAG